MERQKSYYPGFLLAFQRFYYVGYIKGVDVIHLSADRH